MLRRLLAVFMTTAATAAVALAGPQTYAAKVQSIRAGIVILDSARSSAAGSVPQSAAPHVWFNFDANKSVKPIGWQISNPHAPSRVTQAIQDRWRALTGVTQTLGVRLSKRTAPYWEVFLSNTTDAALSDYDVLLVNPLNFISLNAMEREKLHRFVDHGGLLWIDPAGVSSMSGYDITNGFPVPFQPGIGDSVGANFADFTNPLLSRPLTLSYRDVDLLNTGGFNLTINPLDFTGNSIQSYFTSLAGQSLAIRGVSFFKNAASAGTNSETIGVAQSGAGFVVITSRGASIKLNRVAGASYTTNTGFGALAPTLEVDGLAACKLVVNMISLLSEYRQQGGNSLKSNGSAISLTAPLLNRLVDHSVSFNTAAKYNNGSVVYKGLVIASDSANGRLIAYDARSNNDLDGDGLDDDGQLDTPGSNVDIVWQVSGLTGPISPPVVADLPQNPLHPEMVMVVDGNGVVHGYDPFERLPNGRLSPGPHTEIMNVTPPAADAVVSTGETPNPPTVHEGMAYICDRIGGAGSDRGRVWVINLATGTRMRSSGNDWYLGGNSSPFQSEPFATSPTVGYIPIFDNSGGVDKVMYAQFQGNDTTGTPPGFVSLFLGVKGEKPISFDSIPGGLQVTTRASQRGGLPIYENPGANDPLNIKLTVQDAAGNPWSAAQMAAVFSGQPQDQGGGVLLFPYNGAATLPANVTVRVDYNIDWGQSTSGLLAAVERGRIQLPDKLGAGNTPRKVTGPLALTPAGTLYMTVSGGNTAGLFGFREDGRGSFRCTFRYELYPKYTFNAQGVGPDVQPPVVEDNDVIAKQMAPGILDKPFTNFAIIGGPSVRNGQVFISVAAGKGFIPTGLVMAFRSEPETPQFRVDDVPDGSVLVQADLVRSTSISNPDIPTIFPGSNFSYDPESKTLRLESLMNVQNGQMQQAMNLSQRIYIRRPGQPDLAIDPDNQGGDARWSPLLWYTVSNGATPTTGPLVTGDTLFVGATSMVRNGLATGTFPAPSDGLIFALTSQISANDEALKITPGRPWIKQLSMISDKPRWPYLADITSMADYIQRLNQSILPQSSTTLSLSGGDGTLVAQGDGGLYTYDRADFLVADQGRLVTFDPSGEPIWSASATYSAGADASGGAANLNPLVRPTRAYRLNQTDMLVVDSGANRVVRMNQEAIEQRALSGFKLDPSHTPNGYAANETLRFNDPRDALTFTSIENLADITSSVSPGDGEGESGYEYWIHYLVADAGNHRLIETVDRYGYDVTTGRILDPVRINGVAQLGVLVWHSPANVSGKQYAYNSVVRIPVPNPDGTQRYVYVTSVKDVQPTQNSLGVTSGSSTESGGGNGGVIVFDPARPGPFVFNEMLIPQIGANVLWNQSTGLFNQPLQPAVVHPFTNISAVTASVELRGAQLVTYLMITDATGVYEAYFPINAAGTPPSRLDVDWMMPNEVYRVMRRDLGGVPAANNAGNLRATYARRLNSDSVVIVNGYFGTQRDGVTPFKGEVLQIDGVRDPSRLTTTNLGYNNSSITFELRSINGARGLVLPVFADRR
ncbi:hypothetical protein [Fimbriimonas ginsengisoli]|uniref:DUF4159 domain-containing protein n=1 Tax=Fimbriimonas ginsengisoli Gsoil 348 TaxID=661478 RepID=A0A068NQC7_FIMGI|nr:hypothetical protein [Fimbriimonas ginsengisoli]AIE85773.1 hypothetical protein OP10G_2405 [Fimbriimonas ginsengisoli Gsoil 348]